MKPRSVARDLIVVLSGLLETCSGSLVCYLFWFNPSIYAQHTYTRTSDPIESRTKGVTTLITRMRATLFTRLASLYCLITACASSLPDCLLVSFLPSSLLPTYCQCLNNFWAWANSTLRSPFLLFLPHFPSLASSQIQYKTTQRCKRERYTENEEGWEVRLKGLRCNRINCNECVCIVLAPLTFIIWSHPWCPQLLPFSSHPRIVWNINWLDGLCLNVFSAHHLSPKWLSHSLPLTYHFSTNLSNLSVSL